jgi:DNA replication protein DnaC
VNIHINTRGIFSIFSPVYLRSRIGTNNRIKNAKFPYVKYLEELKYDAFPLEVSNKIRELQNLSFIDQGKNVILVGNPGIGKTHKPSDWESRLVC